MPIKYKYDRNTNIVYSHPSGLISISDISQYFNKLLEDQNVGNDFIEIVNLDEVNDFQFSYDEALHLPHLITELKINKNYKNVIFIAKNNFHFGMARMMSTTIEKDFAVSIVRSQEDAEKEINLIRG